MKLLLDENLSARLVRLLGDSHPGSEHVQHLGLQGATDQEIWNRAWDEGFAIVSKDSDFADLSVLRGHPPKVIVIRAGNAGTDSIAQLITANRERLEAFDADPEAGLIELSQA